MDIGALLRRSREAAGLSLGDLATRCGMSRATLAAYERGVQVPALARVEHILAEVGLQLGLSVEPLGTTRPEQRLAAIDDKLLDLLADLGDLPCVVELPPADLGTIDLLVARDAADADSLVRWAGRQERLRVRLVDRLPDSVPVRVGERTVRVLAGTPDDTD
jgi:transcriptional regulator with XRE-family HTH domain